MFDPALPLATWMQRGGDHRQVPDPTTGLTRYRTALEPRPGVPLGSCTASSPSDRAWSAMSEALGSLRDAPDKEFAFEAHFSGVRRRLVDWAGLAAGAPVLLAPSGTDVLYLVNHLVLRGAESVHHVVVGASELGGGTLRACQGLTFSALSPFGDPTDPGRPIEGLAERCTAAPVYLRDGDGQRLQMDEVDAHVRRQVTEAVEAGHRVVLHLVAHSKTGLRAPSLAEARSLRLTHGESVQVLVDAAQGRLAPHDIRTALDAGFMVLFTGSKFYSGPPFSAALYLPEQLAGDPGPLPADLGDWFASADLLPGWERARASLAQPYNAGLALRWQGALSDIEAYHRIDPRERARVYHTFAGAVLEAFGPSEIIEVDMPVPPVHRLVTGLGAYPTVFGFQVMGPDGALHADALRRLHAQLDTDHSATHPELGGRFHLGQPVALGAPTGEREAVLRVALGAALITHLAGLDDAGAGWLRAQFAALRAKIERLISLGEAGAP